MKTMMTRLLAAGVALCALPTTAHAAVSYTVVNGKLTGVSGVMFNDQSFDVAFVEGTCAVAYGKCASRDDILSGSFGDGPDNHTALQALRDQALLRNVVVDGVSYDFSNGQNVYGLGNAGGTILLPVNAGAYGAFVITLGSGMTNPDIYSADTSLDDDYVWSRFSLTPTAALPVVTSPVPEPATWALMLTGFGLIGAALRRRRAAAAHAFA